MGKEIGQHEIEDQINQKKIYFITYNRYFKILNSHQVQVLDLNQCILFLKELSF